MELFAEFTFCLIDRLPIEQSPAYRDLCFVLGKSVADRWTYTETVEVISRHPPPERGEDSGRSIGVTSTAS